MCPYKCNQTPAQDKSQSYMTLTNTCIRYFNQLIKCYLNQNNTLFNRSRLNSVINIIILFTSTVWFVSVSGTFCNGKNKRIYHQRVYDLYCSIWIQHILPAGTVARALDREALQVLVGPWPDLSEKNNHR